jgi:ABC-type Zn uptake system ZnuABC Zn-binding protein ZnuA
MAPNADPHDYEPRPRDIGALGEADLVVRSGGDLDGWLTDALESAGGAAESLTLMDSVDAAGDDPHWWHDPRNAQKAVAAIGAKLAELDPAGRATYERGAAAYVAQLDDLDGAIERCIGAIPAERRKLVTSHDALGYYARRYDLEVIGTVIASLSTSGQASAGEAAALVETIREAGVPVIFAETSVNPKVEQAIAREAGARMGDPLFADGLGPAGSKGATYLDAMRSNTLAIARGLGGQAAGCDLGG